MMSTVDDDFEKIRRSAEIDQGWEVVDLGGDVWMFTEPGGRSVPVAKPRNEAELWIAIRQLRARGLRKPLP